MDEGGRDGRDGGGAAGVGGGQDEFHGGDRDDRGRVQTGHAADAPRGERRGLRPPHERQQGRRQRQRHNPTRPPTKQPDAPPACLLKHRAASARLHMYDYRLYLKLVKCSLPVSAEPHSNS